MLLLTYQTLTETQNDARGSEFDWRIIKIWNFITFYRYSWSDLSCYIDYRVFFKYQNLADRAEGRRLSVKICRIEIAGWEAGFLRLPVIRILLSVIFIIINKKSAVACKCCNWDQSDNHLASTSSFQFNENYCSRQTDNFTLSAINITTQRHKNFVKTFDYHYPLLWSGLSLKGLTERVIVQTKN